MRYEVLEEPIKTNRREWSEFVYNHPEGNIFQTPEMFDVYNETDKYEPFVFAVVNDRKKFEAILIAVIQKEHKGLMGIFSSRAIIFGGPLV
ncbi:MAG: hypothetical protein KAS97_02505, partial [Candidatus Aminicenantes bacterium]|nr:hypothetical protein [Candidatus Aminicenantes bacterium]